MKVIAENEDFIAAYVTEVEMIDGDEVIGMMMDEGVMVYLVKRMKHRREEG